MNPNPNKSLIILSVVLALVLSLETIYLITSHSSKSKKDLESVPSAENREVSRPSGWRQLAATPFRNQTKPRSSTSDQTALDAWDPFEEMERMHNQINQMFRDSFSRSVLAGPNFDLLQKNILYEPDVDISESDSDYIVKFDLPGMEKDTINVEVSDRALTISGERKFENKEKGEDGSFHRMERSFGAFHRTIPLPNDADTEEVKADYKNGVMTITIPKLTAPETRNATAKKIEIR